MFHDPVSLQHLVEAQHRERLQAFEKIRMAELYGVPVKNQFLAQISASLKGWIQQIKAAPTIDVRRTTASYPVVK
jgi:hypothetical protein